jgi:amidohydrolase
LRRPFLKDFFSTSGPPDNSFADPDHATQALALRVSRRNPYEGSRQNSFRMESNPPSKAGIKQGISSISKGGFRAIISETSLFPVVCLLPEASPFILILHIPEKVSNSRGRKMDRTKKIVSAIEGAAADYRKISQKIFEWKELGPSEFKSVGLLIEELGRLGFAIKRDLKVPADLVEGGVAKTAFRAEMMGKGPGPTITLMLEYDALPNGHSCGHNLIAGSGLLAAAGLAEVMAETPGRLLVIGTPDEERSPLGGGKVALLEGGHFEGSDVVFITHPIDRWSVDQRLLAVKGTKFTFRGKTAHAAAQPHKGVSALNAVIHMFNGINLLREHLRQDIRIHGIITQGGDRPNIVPELAEAEFMVRALDTKTMEETFRKVVNCAKAAELAMGAKLEFHEPRTDLKATVIVPELVELMQRQLLFLGISEAEIKEHAGFGSSDLGNVGNAFPTFNQAFKIAPEGTMPHTDAFREAAGSEDGWKGAVIAGKAVALAAYDLLTHPDRIAAIKSTFDKLKAGEAN